MDNKGKNTSEPRLSALPPASPAASTSTGAVVDDFRRRLDALTRRAPVMSERPSAQRPALADAHHSPSGGTEPVYGRGPVGAGERVVRPGECVASIAKSSGHFWETIWTDAGNASLRETRQNPNILLPGDRLHVPPLRQKWDPAQTELRHRYVRRGEPCALRLRVLNDGEPRAREAYTLEIDGESLAGFTDNDGRLAHAIPANARRGRLVIGADRQTYELALGETKPIDELAGVQSRLNNLGFAAGRDDGVMGPKTRAALRAFQRRWKLPQTGEPDDATRQKLREVHGS